MIPFLMYCSCLECWARSAFLTNAMIDLSQTEAIYGNARVYEANPFWRPLVEAEAVGLPYVAFHLAMDAGARSLPKGLRAPAYLWLAAYYALTAAHNGPILGSGPQIRFTIRL